MTKKIRLILIGLAAFLSLVALWAGASIYAGKQFAARLQELATKSDARSAYTISQLDHQPGLFASSGTLTIRLIDACDESGATPEIGAAKLSYQVAHLILPGSLLRVDWTLAPSDTARASFEKLFGGEAKLSGTGKIDFSGALHSDMHLPQLKLARQGGVVTISPSSGRLAVGKETLVFDWKTDKLTARGDGSALELTNVEIALDLKNRQRGIGTASFSLDKISTSLGSAEGFKLASVAAEKDNKLDLSLTQSLKSVQVGDKLVSDLMLQLVFNGLDAASVETLINLSGQSCGFRNLTLDEKERARVATRGVLMQGFSAGIAKVTGTVDGGSLNGKWLLELGKSAGPELALATALKSTGELTLTGKAVSAEEKKTAVSYGLATETPLGLKATLNYSDGILKLNNQVFDATLFLNAVSAMEKEINDFLSGKVKPKAPAAALPAAEENQAPTEEGGEVDPVDENKKI